jgi:hypothetical protein
VAEKLRMASPDCGKDKPITAKQDGLRQGQAYHRNTGKACSGLMR